jgi:hypothetical protein
MPDPTGLLVEALHAYLDAGGDTDSMLDLARMVADERPTPEDFDGEPAQQTPGEGR